MLAPVDDEVVRFIELCLDANRALLIVQRAVFRGVRDELVNHQRQYAESLMLQARTSGPMSRRRLAPPFKEAPASDSTSALNNAGPHRSAAIKSCARASAWTRTLTTSMNCSDDQIRIVTLRDQSADQAQDVSYAVVELGDQQILSLHRAAPFFFGLIGQAQNHFDQADAQVVRDAQVYRRPRGRLARDGLAPRLETFAAASSRSPQRTRGARVCSDRRPNRTMRAISRRKKTR